LKASKTRSRNIRISALFLLFKTTFFPQALTQTLTLKTLVRHHGLLDLKSLKLSQGGKHEKDKWRYDAVF
jgi:hypothetical protein